MCLSVYQYQFLTLTISGMCVTQLSSTKSKINEKKWTNVTIEDVITSANAMEDMFSSACVCFIRGVSSPGFYRSKIQVMDRSNTFSGRISRRNCHTEVQLVSFPHRFLGSNTEPGPAASALHVSPIRWCQCVIFCQSDDLGQKIYT